MKTKDSRDISPEEQKVKLRTLRNEKLTLRMQQRTGQLERPSRMREIRRDIARLLTELNKKAS